MKTWKIPVTWEMCAMITVEANTLEEAMEEAKDEAGIIPIPSDADYVDDSWHLSTDNPDYIREYYNGNQEDESEEQ